MSTQELIGLFAEALEVDPEVLSLDTEISSIEEWDSVGWLTIMSYLDEKFGIQIGAKEVRGFETVQQVVDYVVDKGAAVG